MYNYPEIGKQLQLHVDLYSKEHPRDSVFEDIIDNTIIYNRQGCFVMILRTLVGSKTTASCERFDLLCQRYQTSKLSDIPQEDANELWELFHQLTETQ